MLEISPSAAKEIKRIQENKQQPDTFLKLKIISGGCSGFFYQLQIDSADSLKDTGDRDSFTNTFSSIEVDGIKIFIDEPSWQYVENLKIDYAEDLMGGGFRFNNPLAKDVCGCGMSFAIAEVDFKK